MIGVYLTFRGIGLFTCFIGWLVGFVVLGFVWLVFGFTLVGCLHFVWVFLCGCWWGAGVVDCSGLLLLVLTGFVIFRLLFVGWVLGVVFCVLHLSLVCRLSGFAVIAKVSCVSWVSAMSFSVYCLR